MKIEFEGSLGAALAARLDEPKGAAGAYALFAHCFTCSKDIAAASRISRGLAERGFGVLRFDFTGLGHSEGEFSSTNFSSNVGDLMAAVEWLRENRKAPALLVGHSLGGAAVLAAAGGVPECRAVATIGAPADPGHVVKLFTGSIDAIREEGSAEVDLAGRRFRIAKQFLDDLDSHNQAERIASLRRALVILHSPRDSTVGIDNAARIFETAKHPKSFISLDDADHLLRERRDAEFVADVLAAWAARYMNEEQ